MQWQESADQLRRKKSAAGIIICLLKRRFGTLEGKYCFHQHNKAATQAPCLNLHEREEYPLPVIDGNSQSTFWTPDSAL